MSHILERNPIVCDYYTNVRALEKNNKISEKKFTKKLLTLIILRI